MSLLTGSGGGGLSADARSGASTGGVGPVTVNNSSGLSTNSILAIAAAAVAGFLFFALLHGQK